MSKIEWTDQTWNPTTGCDKVSAGCKNCYAEKMHKRLRGMNQAKYQHAFLGDVRTHRSSLSEPFKWKKPRMVFVNSMSDLFHKDVPFHFINKVFQVMAQTPQHTYQILTKRPERMAEYLAGRNAEVIVWQEAGFNHPEAPRPWPLPNVWLGTSVENQEQADKRIPFLLQCPAAVRFLSCEPLLGRLDLVKFFHDKGCYYPLDRHTCQCWPPNQQFIDWVIVGGESGPGARPMHPDWLRGLKTQCETAKIPFFFKQWGAYMPIEVDWPTVEPMKHKWNKLTLWTDRDKKMFELLFPDGERLVAAAKEDYPEFQPVSKVGKKKAGNLLDGEQWLQFPSIKNLQSKITTP